MYTSSRHFKNLFSMAVENSTSKRQCKRIGTHNGKFHCDEVLACFMLRKLEEFGTAEIVRTRDPKVCTCALAQGAAHRLSSLYQLYTYRVKWGNLEQGL